MALVLLHLLKQFVNRLCFRDKSCRTDGILQIMHRFFPCRTVQVALHRIPDMKFGDRATLVGHDGDAYLSIDELASLSGRFNYEFICDINKRVPREYLRDGKVVEQVDYF